VDLVEEFAVMTITQVDELARTNAAALLALSNANAAQTALQGLSAWQPLDYLLVGDICSARADHACAADGFIQASIALGYQHPDLPEDLHEKIWEELSLSDTGPQAFTHRYHHAWWLLQQEVRNAGSLSQQRDVWEAWQRRYPSHPASLTPPLALAALQNYRLPRVAVILPLSGRFARAGQAVRDGFVAAYLAEGGNPPAVDFIDSNGVDVAQVWEEALAVDAEVIVGPLLKPEVARYAQITEHATQLRLALNYLDEPNTEPHPSQAKQNTPQPSSNSPLYQFGIAIEDEARSLADAVLSAGHEKLLVVRSADRWAQRANKAFADAWPHPRADARFEDAKALTEAVGRAMQVEASDTRMRRIANILGQPLEFLPRARSDLDGVVAFVSAAEAKALRPALRFHFANDLPVYTTSQAARGDAQTSIAGFNLTEMPMIADPDTDLKQLVDAFNLAASTTTDLYALGFDAYRLASWLPAAAKGVPLSINGASGLITQQTPGVWRRALNIKQITAQGTFISTP